MACTKILTTSRYGPALLPLAAPALMLLLSGCGVAAGATLMPAAGPLFEARAPAIRVLYSGAPTGQGSFRVTMPDGELITGQFRTLGGYTNSSAGGASAPGSLAVTQADWKTLYGTADMVGSQITGQLAGTGDRGTVLRGEYVTDAMNGNGYGVAKDSRGNLYQLKFAAPPIY